MKAMLGRRPSFWKRNLEVSVLSLGTRDTNLYFTDTYAKILLADRMIFVSSVVSVLKNCFRKQVLGRCTCVLDSSVIAAGISRPAGNETHQLNGVV
jgi:hypothetical protein